MAFDLTARESAPLVKEETGHDQSARDPETVCNRVPPHQPCDSTGRQRADSGHDQGGLNERLPTGRYSANRCPVVRRCHGIDTAIYCAPRVASDGHSHRAEGHER